MMLPFFLSHIKKSLVLNIGQLGYSFLKCCSEVISDLSIEVNNIPVLNSPLIQKLCCL